MIKTAKCNSAKVQFLDGLHRKDHNYKMALYADNAELDEWTTNYTALGEVSGQGYMPGGALLSGRKCGLIDRRAFLQWEPARWGNSKIRASGAMIYNDSIGDKPALFVFSFGRNVASENSEFIAEIPERLIEME